MGKSHSKLSLNVTLNEDDTNIIVSSSSKEPGTITRISPLIEKFIDSEVVDFSYTIVGEKEIKEIELLTSCKHFIWTNASLRSLPSSLYTLTQITTLDISNNLFYKHPPEDIIKFSSLTSLNISCCTLRELGTSITKLPNLKELYLDGNSVFNHHSKEHRKFLELSNLLKLSLGSCGLRNTNSLGGLSNLEVLDASYNLFSDLGEIEQLINLKSLNVESTSLKHLQGIGYLINLEELKVKNCYQVKELPEEIIKCCKLQKLDVTGISFDGQIGKVLSKLPNLQELRVSSTLSPMGCEIINFNGSLFNIRMLFPYLSDSTLKYIELQQAMHPSLDLSALTFVTKIFVKVLTITFEFTNENNEWIVSGINYSNSESFDNIKINHEYQGFSLGYDFIIGDNGRVIVLQQNLWPLVIPSLTRDSKLQKIDTTSIMVHTNYVWIIDTNNTLWRLNSSPDYSQYKIDDFKCIQTVLKLESGKIWSLSVDGCIYTINQCSDIPICTKIDLEIPMKYISLSDQYFLGIDSNDMLWSATTHENSLNELTNLSEKYQLPPLIFCVVNAIRINETYCYFLIDEYGNGWSKGYNKNGVLYVNNKYFNGWVSSFTKMIEPNLDYIYPKTDSTIIVNNSGQIFETGKKHVSNDFIFAPMLLPYAIPRNIRVKSARK